MVDVEVQAICDPTYAQLTSQLLVEESYPALTIQQTVKTAGFQRCCFTIYFGEKEKLVFADLCLTAWLRRREKQ